MTKIFIIGFPKCGTTSLNNYFKNNGLKTLHYFNFYEEVIETERLTFRKVKNRAPTKEDFIGLIIKDNCDNKKPLMTNIKDFDVITQLDYSGGYANTPCYFPQIDLFKQIYEEYPDSLFIFNTRSFDKWYSSMKRWYNLLDQYKNSGLIKDTTQESVKEWYNSHFDNVSRFFSNKQDQLLVYNIETDNIEKLNNFTKLHSVKVLPQKNKSK